MASRKARSKKQTTIAKVATRAQRKPRTRRRRRAMKTAIHPFIACTYGPVDMASSGHGVPDGSNRKSIVVDHRQTVIIKPTDSGDIIFALVPSPFGAVGMGAGKFEATLNGWSGNHTQVAESGIIVTSATAPTTGDYFNYSLVPFVESLVPAGTPIETLTSGGLKIQAYRMITQVARVMYIGPTVDDQGVATTARMSMPSTRDVSWADIARTKPGTIPTNILGELAQLPPFGFSATAQLPGSAVFPFRQSRDLINVPSSYDWSDMRPSWGPAVIDRSVSPARVIHQFGGTLWYGDAAGGTPTSCGNGGLGSADVTFYAARNVAPDQGIVVEVRTCMEYALGYDSPAIRMAQFSPLAQPQVVEEVKAMSRALPSSQPSTSVTAEHGWLYNAAAWYGSTMKSLIGTSWSIGGRLLGLTAGRAIGGMGSAGMQAIANVQASDPSPFTRGAIPIGWR